VNIIATDNGFRVEGCVSFDHVVALRFLGEKIIVENAASNNIVIELCNMKEQDASIFSMLLCWQRIACKNKKTIKLINLTPSMRRMQKMFGLVWIN